MGQKRGYRQGALTSFKNVRNRTVMGKCRILRRRCMDSTLITRLQTYLRCPYHISASCLLRLTRSMAFIRCTVLQCRLYGIERNAHIQPLQGSHGSFSKRRFNPVHTSQIGSPAGTRRILTQLLHSPFEPNSIVQPGQCPLQPCRLTAC